MRLADRIYVSGLIAGIFLGAVLAISGISLAKAFLEVKTALARPALPHDDLEKSAWEIVRDQPEYLSFDDALVTLDELRVQTFTAWNFEDTGKERLIGTLDSAGRFRLAKGLCDGSR